MTPPISPALAGAEFHHVGIVVADLDAAAATYRALGFEELDRFAVAQQGIEAVVFGLGAGFIELISPTDGEGAIAKFMAKRGEGMHHAAYRVDDIDATLAALAKQGIELIDTAGRPGGHGWRVGFLHPRACAGVLTELVEVIEEVEVVGARTGDGHGGAADQC